MDYKKNDKYFKKLNLIPLWIGIALIVFGFAFFFIANWKISWLGFIIAVVGIILCVIPFSGATKGKDLDDQAQRIFDGTLETMYKRIANTGNAKVAGYDKNWEKKYPPMVSGGYNFEGECQIKEDGDGTTRSDQYKIVGMLFEDTLVHVYENAFSFVSPDQKDSLNKYKYVNMDKVTLEEKTRKIPGTEKDLTYYVLHILMNDGSDIAIPVVNDASTDETVSTLNRRIEQRKAAAQEA